MKTFTKEELTIARLSGQFTKELNYFLLCEILVKIDAEYCIKRKIKQLDCVYVWNNTWKYAICFIAAGKNIGTIKEIINTKIENLEQADQYIQSKY